MFPNFAKVWQVARRDFRSYFNGPIAYIIITLMMAVSGYMFYQMILHFELQAMQYRQYGSSISLVEIIRNLFGNLNVLFLLMMPLITMRLFAEERKNQTISLLLTTPLTLTEIVLGKFLAAFLLLCSILLLTLIYPVVLMLAGNLPLGPVLAIYLGMLLMGSCYIALGTFFSATTDNQIIAAALTWTTSLFFWLVSWAKQTAGPVMGEVFGYLSLIEHYTNFARGMISSADLMYYFSFIGIFLYLAHWVLDSYRWR